MIPGDDALHEGSLLHQAGEVPAAPVHPITNYISLELQIQIILFGSGFGRNLLLAVFSTNSILLSYCKQKARIRMRVGAATDR